VLLRPAFGGLDCFAARQCGLEWSRRTFRSSFAWLLRQRGDAPAITATSPLIFGYPYGWTRQWLKVRTKWRVLAKTSARKSINTVVFVVVQKNFTWLKTDVRRKYVESVGLGSIMSPSLFLKIDIPLTCCSAKNLGPTQFNRFSERASVQRFRNREEWTARNLHSGIKISGRPRGRPFEGKRLNWPNCSLWADYR